MQCGIDDPHSGILDIYISLAYTDGVVSKSLKANRGIVELEREVSGQRFSTIIILLIISCCPWALSLF